MLYGEMLKLGDWEDSSVIGSISTFFFEPDLLGSGDSFNFYLDMTLHLCLAWYTRFPCNVISRQLTVHTPPSFLQYTKIHNRR